jgi:putative Mg2+ transporter-C (MgtC) family protein
MWEQITAMVAQEFSDLPDVAEATRIVLRLALAALLGGLLGIEREAKGKAAGVRTHMMVAMGVLASLQFDIQPADMSRVLQGVIAGVGFLGAGTILKGDAESQVKGLTTAAGIWMTAAIGVAAGMGKEATAVLATLLTLAILASLPLIAALFERKDADAGRAIRPDDPP